MDSFLRWRRSSATDGDNGLSPFGRVGTINAALDMKLCIQLFKSKFRYEKIKPITAFQLMPRCYAS